VPPFRAAPRAAVDSILPRRAYCARCSRSSAERICNHKRCGRTSSCSSLEDAAALSKGSTELAGDAESAAPPDVPTTQSHAHDVIASDDRQQRRAPRRARLLPMQVPKAGADRAIRDDFRLHPNPATRDLSEFADEQSVS
jgi:hypothetical protein